MNHFVLILYFICSIADIVTIVVSGFLYRELRLKALKYLVFIMAGALLSMVVELVRIYSRIVPVHMEFSKQIVYIVFDPIGEILQFFLLPALVFVVFGKEFPRKLRIVTMGYAAVVVATFPLEVFSLNPLIQPARDFAGYFVFYSFSYFIIFLNYRKVKNADLQNALRNYLILALIMIPSTVIFQTGITAGFIHIRHPEIPFPYILYCLSFNILCLINAYNYLFTPMNREKFNVTDVFLQNHKITERENEIITLLIRGYNNDQIAGKLFISPGTVKNHIYRIFQKTGVQSRTQLVYKIHLHQ